MTPKLREMLKVGGAAFGLGAVAADMAGGWVSLLGLTVLAAAFILPPNVKGRG